MNRMNVEYDSRDDVLLLSLFLLEKPSGLAGGGKSRKNRFSFIARRKNLG